MFGLDLMTSLILAVVAAVSALLGVALGSVLSDLFFPGYLEHRRQKNELSMVYEKFSTPLRWSANELAFRLFSIVLDSPNLYLRSAVLESIPDRPISNTVDDPYHQRYRFLSSVYRLCAFLGWLELYRQETTYLKTLDKRTTKNLQNAIDRIRSNLATGILDNPSYWHTWVDELQSEVNSNGTGYIPDWSSWSDSTIYREELRAIGESMIVDHENARTVMGFARFVEAYESDTASTTKRWSLVVARFLADFGSIPRDFRHIRLERFLVSLIDLMKVLSDEPVPQPLLKRQKQLSDRLSNRAALSKYIAGLEHLGSDVNK